MTYNLLHYTLNNNKLHISLTLFSPPEATSKQERALKNYIGSIKNPVKMIMASAPQPM